MQNIQLRKIWETADRCMNLFLDDLRHLFIEDAKLGDSSSYELLMQEGYSSNSGALLSFSEAPLLLHTGNCTVNVVTWLGPSLWAEITPSCASTKSLVMNSPRPLDFFLVSHLTALNTLSHQSA